VLQPQLQPGQYSQDQVSETWTEAAPEWEDKEWLRYDWPAAWTEALRFSEAEARVTPPGPSGPPEGLLSRGLYWEWLPLYDRRSAPDDLYRCMLEELYLTSVFNPRKETAHPADLRAEIRERFLLPYRRAQKRDELLAQRDDRVLQLRIQGKSLREIACILLEEDLYPLFPQLNRKERSGGPQAPLSNALRTIWSIKERLKEEGRLSEEDDSYRGT